jgi:hypothetical protein
MKDYETFEKSWIGDQKTKWMKQAHVAVADTWNDKAKLVLKKEGWPQLRVNPVFRLEFTGKDIADVCPQVAKIPPVRPEFFNCGGTWVGLDQIIQKDPMLSSKAFLTSESGKPVAMNAGLLMGNTRPDTIHYNVMAHEFGHMLGLPDEYEVVEFGDKGTNRTKPRRSCRKARWIWRDAAEFRTSTLATSRTASCPGEQS